MAFLLAIYYLATSKGFAFVDVGSDTFFCFYPLQVAVSRQLHELHFITWSFDLGLGGYLGSMFDPLLLLTGWLPDSWQLGSRLPMFALRAIAGGSFFYGYLRLLKFRAATAVLGGLCYAFSSYGMLNAQWEVMHGTEFVQFAAFLFLFEKYLATQRWWAPVTAGIVIGLGHAMGLYMFGLFGLIYALTRAIAIPVGDKRSFAGSVLRFAAWCVPGLLIAAPLLFPAVYYLLESPRVSGNYSQLHALLSQIFQINNRATLSSEIAGLVGKDLLGSNMHYVGWGNYFEGPGFYIGLLPLLCIPQLLGPSATQAERRLCVIGLVGIALYFVFPALRTAVYGFGEPTFRFSTLWISALLLVLGLAGLRRLTKSGTWGLGMAIGTGLVLAIPITAALLLPAKVGIEQVIRVVAFALMYVAILSLWEHASWRNGLVRLLLPIVACELLMFAIPPLVERDAVALDASSPVGRYHDGTDQALVYVRQYQRQYSGNDDFYRIEKTYYSVFLDDALVQDYPGTASYFFHAASITRFVDRMNLGRITPSPNYISSMADRRDVLNLLGVKYLLSLDRKPDTTPGMVYVATVGNINIYRNTTAHAFGTFYSSIVPEASADALPVPQRDAFLLSHVVVENRAEVNSRLAALQAGPVNDNPNPQVHIEKLRDDELSGKIETPAASLLLLAMPFDRGWSAQMDGTPLELFRADYGLTAALIPAGVHSLALDYSPPGRRLGFWLSLVTVCLLAAIFLIGWHARAKPAPGRMHFTE